MGHKVHPVGFRLGVIKNWEAKWYADRHYVNHLQEDLKLRKALGSMYPEAGVSLIEIDRQANNVSLTIHTARPGILIGRGGQRVDEMRKKLENIISKKVQLNIREIPQPEFDAYLVAKSIAESMERRVSYRRAMKQALQRSVMAGAKGVRICASGRLDGAEIARSVTMLEGRVPLHTLRADIDYGFTEAKTVMGRIGVKVWIYKGEILPEKEEVEFTEVMEKPAAVQEEAAEAVTPVRKKVKAVTKEETAEDTTEPKAEEAPAEEEKQAAKKTRKATVKKTEEKEVEAVEPAEAKAEKPAEKKTRKTAAEKEETAAKVETEEKAEEKKTTKKPSAAKNKEAKIEETAEAEAEATAEEQGDSDVTA